MAFIRTFLKSFPSKKACIAIGTVTWHVSLKVCHFLISEIGSKLYLNLSSMYFFISSLLLFCLARYIVEAIAQAPFIPSGWLWDTEAVISAYLFISSRLLYNQATDETLIPEPLPKLLYGLGFSSLNHSLNFKP